MRFVTPMFIVGILATACGTQHKNADAAAPTPAPMSAEQAAVADQLPKSAIARVQLDAQGNPVGAPEVRTSNVDGKDLSGTALASAFDGSSATPNVVKSQDELDKTSSTQSWFWGRSNNNYGYNSYGSYNNYGGYGYGGGYSGYNNSYGYGNGYSTYYGGYNFGYGYNSYYGNNNYGYYSYCR